MVEAAADVVVGLVWLVAGGLLFRRREDRGSALLLGATGLAWVAGSLVEGLVLLHRGPLAHVLLAYPGGALAGVVERLVVAGAYLEGAVLSVGRATVVTLVLAGGMVGLATWRWGRETGAVRSSRAVPVVAAALVGGVLAAGAIARVAGVALGAWLSLSYDGVLVATAVMLFVDLRAGGWGRAAVAGLVVDLGAGGADSLARRLARAVGDPSLEVAYALDDGVTFVDDRGRPIALPGSDSVRAVTRFADGDRAVAALIHDPAALRDPQLLAGAGAALRVAVENVRLGADLDRHVTEVERSRRRLLDASDEQRGRFAAELDAGVIPQLDDAAQIVALAGSDDEDAEVAELQRRLAAVGDQLRRLTLGLRPAGLRELGLGHALGQLVADAPLEVCVTVPAERFEGDVESTAWFVCSEGLANVIKHANATRVEIRVAARGDRLRVEVCDDGAGGADPGRGSGLRGLAARVEAVGGVLSVRDRVGGGTLLVAELPAVPSDG